MSQLDLSEIWRFFLSATGRRKALAVEHLEYTYRLTGVDRVRCVHYLAPLLMVAWGSMKPVWVAPLQSWFSYPISTPASVTNRMA